MNVSFNKNIYSINQISKRQSFAGNPVKSSQKTINLNNNPASYYNRVSFAGGNNKKENEPQILDFVKSMLESDDTQSKIGYTDHLLEMPTALYLLNKKRETLQNSANALLGALLTENNHQLQTNYLCLVHRMIEMKPTIVPNLSYEPLEQYMEQNSDFPPAALKIMKKSGRKMNTPKPSADNVKPKKEKPVFTEQELEELRANRKARKAAEKMKKKSMSSSVFRFQMILFCFRRRRAVIE